MAGLFEPYRRLRLATGRDHTLGNVLERLAGVHGRRTLYEEAGRAPVTYAGAADLVARWAASLHARIAPGDRVVLATPNGYEQLLLSFAVCRAGGIAVPLNAQMRPEEVDHVRADAEAALVLHGARELTPAEPMRWCVHAAPDALAALFYTSGTTGTPKGVELTHQALLGAGPRAALLAVDKVRRDEAVVALPVAHIMGFASLLGFAASGVPVYLLPRFRAEDVLDAIERRRATIFVGVPAMYRLLLDAGAAGRDLSSVRVWASGADVMPSELARQFRSFGAAAHLPLLGPVGGAVFFEGYGMVEAGGAVAVKVSGPLERLLPGDAVGLALPGYRLKVVGGDGDEVRPGEVGELWVKGPGVTPGYWGSAEATHRAITEDGWLRTGDLARRGARGTVRFAGRSKDVVKHGGYSVYAVEVEALLRTHPAVADAAVLGVPDERLGEEVVAAVSLAPGAAAEPGELLGFAREHLAHYKCPTRLVVLPELPRGGTGKVQKDQLRAHFT